MADARSLDTGSGEEEELEEAKAQLNAARDIMSGETRFDIKDLLETSLKIHLPRLTKDGKLVTPQVRVSDYLHAFKKKDRWLAFKERLSGCHALCIRSVPSSPTLADLKALVVRYWLDILVNFVYISVQVGQILYETETGPAKEFWNIGLGVGCGLIIVFNSARGVADVLFSFIHIVEDKVQDAIDVLQEEIVHRIEGMVAPEGSGPQSVAGAAAIGLVLNATVDQAQKYLDITVLLPCYLKKPSNFIAAFVVLPVLFVLGRGAFLAWHLLHPADSLASFERQLAEVSWWDSHRAVIINVLINILCSLLQSWPVIRFFVNSAIYTVELVVNSWLFGQVMKVLDKVGLDDLQKRLDAVMDGDCRAACGCFR